MPAAARDTTPDLRARLVAAAEELFFARGVEAVSLREIGVAAGARNASAVQYHLRDRAGVIQAILDKHRPDVDARRHALLDALEADGDGDLWQLAAAYVRPLAAKLTDPAGGPGYLQVMADLVTRPEPVVAWIGGEDPSDSTARWRALVTPFMAPGGVELHRRFTAMQFTHTQLARRAHETRRNDQRLFTSHLTDLVAALLGAPVSPQTARLRRSTRSTSR
ncbi:hypothetical protein DSM112329_03635 [Paraconexibacter sp. AEG42_29]|uniref:TetR family transcriptional regulator n=1 Tax=Paraconexibacter sp. AEG42_29 TaxID=2997339 RepID=A0AAU7AYM1_9ACTN